LKLSPKVRQVRQGKRGMGTLKLRLKASSVKEGINEIEVDAN
jgi:hypothetical protein